MAETPLSANDQAPDASQPLVKRPYQKPVLIKMGTLQNITMAKDSGPVSDGSKSKYNNKTGRGGNGSKPETDM